MPQIQGLAPAWQEARRAKPMHFFHARHAHTRAGAACGRPRWGGWTIAGKV